MNEFICQHGVAPITVMVINTVGFVAACDGFVSAESWV